MAEPVPAFYVIGNLPCLDLVNTEAMANGTRVDLLRDFRALVAWARATGVIGEAETRRAIERWDGTEAGRAALRDAVALRGALREMAGRLAAGRSPSGDLVEIVNHVLASRAVSTMLERRGGAYVTTERPVKDSPLHLVVPAALSAAWLLEHGDRTLVRKCGNPACILYFFDATKNKRRRWCSMDACGSRAKAAAYYRRARG